MEGGGRTRIVESAELVEVVIDYVQLELPGRIVAPVVDRRLLQKSGFRTPSVEVEGPGLDPVVDMGTPMALRWDNGDDLARRVPTGVSDRERQDVAGT